MTRSLPSIDVFWSFRSPYSYLATGRLVDLHARYALDVQVRPVLPIAVRTPEFFQHTFFRSDQTGRTLDKEVLKDLKKFIQDSSFVHPEKKFNLEDVGNIYNVLVTPLKPGEWRKAGLASLAQQIVDRGDYPMAVRNGWSLDSCLPHSCWARSAR